ncbi:MAG: transposase [Chloroflexi bacterium]|nr:transposase [Chloroflexota bacterium]
MLGLDDWARRRGQTYGTILVDWEQQRPIELLEDRTAATFGDWPRAHPGVAVISRDPGGAYAEGARHGAPDAVQVADRFHLLRNLGETLERVLARRHTPANRLRD